ncbi:MAG: Gfo/Idh/MocA family protein [Anaerolineae bacterium]
MRLGIAGLASVYYPHAFAGAARRIEGVELVAAATAGRSEAAIRAGIGMGPQDYAAKYALKLYDDPVEMVRQEGLDGVFICAEFSRMYELAEALAPTGVHLYIAKAMANTVERAERIVRACERAGIVAATGPTMRFDAGLRTAHRRIADGAIGQVVCVRVMHQHGSLVGWPEGDWYLNPEEGGPVLSLGWYVFDAIRWLGGSEIVRLFAEYDNVVTPHSPFMDNGKVVARLQSRAIASADLYFSTRWPFPAWEIEVIGSDGAIKTMQTGYEVMQFGPSGVEAFQQTRNDMVLAEVTDWVDACRSGRRPEVPVADAALTLAACLAARESAASGSPVSLAQ